MEITPDLLKNETQKTINSQMMLLKDLFNSQEFCDVCDMHKATLLDIASASINEVFASSSIELQQNIKVFEMLDSFLGTVEKETGLHPSDATLLLLKLFTDIITQVTTLIKLQEKNKENESEE